MWLSCHIRASKDKMVLGKIDDIFSFMICWKDSNSVQLYKMMICLEEFKEVQEENIPILRDIACLSL